MLEAGQILNQRYRLRQKLGQNGGRQTWQAEDTFTLPRELVTVKLLAFAPQMQWDDLKLFEREANVLKHLNHLRIPKYLDHFSISDCVFWFCLVQTYIPGVSLKEQLIEGQRFSESEVRNIATSLLEILIYLHELSPAVLHRDIKPSNIIIGQDGNVHLVDFGAVQARAAIEGATFTVVGTYGYTPIEQFGGRAVPASDLYALGATLIHLSTGTAPADLPQRNMRIQFSEYLSLSPRLIEWLEILTNPNIEQRFQTARQALANLVDHQTRHKNTLILQKPRYSRIQLKKTCQELEVRIPSRGFRSSDSLLVILVLLLYGASIPFGIITFPLVILFWLVGLIPLAMLIVPAFGVVTLRLDRNQFILKWQLLGLRIRLLREVTTMIKDINLCTDILTQVNGNPLTKITIQFENHRHQFGGIIAPISDAEQKWLIQELRNWLKIT